MLKQSLQMNFCSEQVGAKLPECVIAVLCDILSVRVGLLLVLANNLLPVYRIFVNDHTGIC